MLKDLIYRVNDWMGDNKSDLIIATSLFLVAVIAFGLGRLSVLVEKQKMDPIIVNYQGIDDPGTARGGGTREMERMGKMGEKGIREEAGKMLEAMVYVGSKNSNKYHLPNCPGALRIKDENKVWFSSKEEAESLGYAPAANCDGL